MIASFPSFATRPARAPSSRPPSSRRPTSRARLLRALVVATALAPFALAPSAFAAPPAPSAPEAPATRSTLIVVVNAPVGALDPVAVRDAVARELGVDAVPPDDARAAGARGTLTVSVVAESNELAVSFAEADRAIVSRVVTAPAPGDATLRAAVRLAGNLARREADDLLGLSAAAPTAPAVPPAATPTPTPAALAPATTATTPVELSVFFPLATNADRPDVHTHFDFNLFYGRVGATDGGSLGMVNVAHESARGLRLAFLVNVTGGPLQAVDIGGIANLAGGDVEGAQVSGVFNVARGTMSGVQLGYVFNYAGGPSSGVQASSVNVAGASFVGAQMGLANVAGDVDGFQVGLINVAKRVRGVQLGLINVADDVEGVPVGLVSVTKTGGVHPVLWASSSAYGNAGIKFATKHTYTMVSVAYHDDAGRPLFGPGITLGARIPFEPLAFSVDLQALHLFGGALCCGNDRALRSHDQSQLKLRAMLAYKAAPRLTVFAGGAATGVARYPAFGPDTTTIDLVPEVFGGIEL